MKDIISEQLRNLNLITHGKVNQSALRRLSIGDIVDIGQESLRLTSTEQYIQDRSPYAHTASLAMSGERWPCAAITCRLSRLQQTAYFAALFCDRVYIRNFFGAHAHEPQHYRRDDIDIHRHILEEDITLFLQIEALVNSGMICLISPPNYCPKCLSPRAVLGLHEEETFENAQKELHAMYLSEASLSLSCKEGEYTLHTHGPESLVHGGSHFYVRDDPPPNITRYPSIHRRVLGGEEVSLGQAVRKAIRYDDHLASTLMRSVLFEYACSQCLSTNYLSENPLELNLIKRLSGERDALSDRDILLTSLVAEIPFLANMTPQELIALRKAEGDAYQVFRKAMKDAVDEFISRRGRVSARDGKALYYDVIAPELSKVTVSLRSAQKRILKASGRKVLGWSVTIAASAYAGLLPSSLIAAAGYLGFTKVLADLLADVMSRGDAKEDIRKEKMFFLWKVKKIAEKKANH